MLGYTSRPTELYSSVSFLFSSLEFVCLHATNFKGRNTATTTTTASSMHAKTYLGTMFTARHSLTRSKILSQQQKQQQQQQVYQQRHHSSCMQWSVLQCWNGIFGLLETAAYAGLRTHCYGSYRYS